MSHINGNDMRSRLTINGFTIMELMVGMVVSMAVVAGSVTVYISMVRGHNNQVKVVAMQQNLRATMDYLERNIRMAGYDPFGFAGADFSANVEGFQYAVRSDEISFTADQGRISGSDFVYNPNGTIDNQWNENFVFTVWDDSTPSVITSTLHRVRSNGAGGVIHEELAENIDCLNFVYLDQAGNVIAAPVAPADFDDIAAVQITLVGTFGAAPGFGTPHTDTTVYRNKQGDLLNLQSGANPPNDSIRRLMVTSTVAVRNK
jgi:type IV pilus assembly protein PilW